MARGSLEAQIRNSGPGGWIETLRLGVRVAGALEAAHRVGTLHRDVKPGNILLTDYGEPQLTDLGIARTIGGFETATGFITGSPAFTAPEVLNGASPTAASDVYGLGATLFCAPTGHAAYERRSGEQVLAQFLRVSAQPIPDLRKEGLPNDVCAVIERAMAGQPADRAASAEAFGNELREFLAENVLNALDPAVLDFLLTTSITSRICGGLASALANVDRGQALLEEVEERGLFLHRVDDHREWFRYHHLFAEYSRRRLERDRPEQLETLHYRASAWFAEHNLLNEAVGHALAAGNPDRAADLVEQGEAFLLERSKMTTLLGIPAKLPNSLIASRPRVQPAGEPNTGPARRGVRPGARNGSRNRW